MNDAKTQTASIEALGASSQDLSHTMLMKRLYYDRVGTLFQKVGHIETVDPDGGVHVILPGDTAP